MKLVFLHESRGGTWAEYDTETRLLRERHLELDEPRPYEALQGLYAHLGGEVVAFFRDLDGDLWLRVGDEEGNLSRGASVRWERHGARVTLALVREGQDEIGVEYTPTHRRAAAMLDSSPFVEAEDFDFGMLITNVLRHPGRRARIFRGTSGSGHDAPAG